MNAGSDMPAGTDVPGTGDLACGDSIRHGDSVSSGSLAFMVMAINPIGGLLIAIPLGIFQLGYPAWYCIVVGVPLAYVQVFVVDLGWEWLGRWNWWRVLVERRRSARIERWLSSRRAFWPVVLVTPLIGAWMVMAIMRFARIPQRRFALPMLLGLSWIAVLIAVACVLLPEWTQRFVDSSSTVY